MRTQTTPSDPSPSMSLLTTHAGTSHINSSLGLQKTFKVGSFDETNVNIIYVLVYVFCLILFFSYCTCFVFVTFSLVEKLCHHGSRLRLTVTYADTFFVTL